MKKEEIIETDGSCPFSVSSSININVTSYDLNLDGIIIRYGSTCGFKAKNLNAPFHTFLMNTGVNDVNWKISKNNGSIETIIMNKNHIFFNPANMPISRSTEDYYEFLLIFIDPEKMIASAKTIEKDFNFKELFNINDSHLQHIFKLLLSEVQAENRNGKLFIENLVSLFSMHFIKNYLITDSSLINNIDGFTKEEYEKILLHIDKNLKEKIKLDQLAKEIRTDKFNFIRKFKSSTNITPHQFILQKKLEQSKYLLKELKSTITDIAYMLNFSDQAHFTNSFKKMYGITPNEFRKTLISS